MNFETALHDIAQRFGLEAAALTQYGYEDEHSGWDMGAGEWPVGSLWTVEGRILYALVRTLRPQTVIEIGTHVGCSATHIASALKANGSGKLLTFDVAESIVIPPDAQGVSKVYRHGELIPTTLQKYVEIHQADGVSFVELDLQQADLIYEDGAHDGICTERVWRAGRAKLSPGGMLISHDAAHFLVGQAIRDGIQRAGYDATIYAVQPSDCGLAIWRKPSAAAVPVVEKVVPVDLPDHLRDFVPPDKTPDETLDLEDMTVAELRAYADAVGVDLSQVRRKGDMVAILQGR